jgi:hypothetical protein
MNTFFTYSQPKIITVVKYHISIRLLAGEKKYPFRTHLDSGRIHVSYMSKKSYSYPYLLDRVSIPELQSLIQSTLHHLMGVISDPVLISSKASVMLAISSTFRQILMEAGKEHNKSFVHSTPTHFFSGNSDSSKSAARRRLLHLRIDGPSCAHFNATHWHGRDVPLTGGTHLTAFIS